MRESACIWCMACVTVCPTNSIKVDEANLQVHMEEAKRSA
ncbi:MAG TPA: 4Fe-4S dicluster domain-containing protein [Candidatus Nitrosocosmicus sp.]|nr:4Fe-4S dicluster domain-containing protein [Candidatus Nitrosocosmicus sp.]